MLEVLGLETPPDPPQEELIHVKVGEGIRAVMTNSFIPLTVIESGLLSLLEADSGFLVVGSCQLDEEDSSTVAYALDQKLRLELVTQTLQGLEREFLESQWYDIFCQTTEMHSDLTQTELETIADLAFSQMHGKSLQEMLDST